MFEFMSWPQVLQSVTKCGGYRTLYIMWHPLLKHGILKGGVCEEHFLWHGTKHVLQLLSFVANILNYGPIHHGVSWDSHSNFACCYLFTR